MQHTPHIYHVHPVRRLRIFVREHLWNRIPAKSGFVLSGFTVLLGASAAAVAASQTSTVSTPNAQVTSSISSDVSTQSDTQNTSNKENYSNAAANDYSPSVSSVNINGQTFTAPENGSLHQTITDENGTTQIDISNQHTSVGHVSNTLTTNNTNVSRVYSNSSSSTTYTTNTEFHSGTP